MDICPLWNGPEQLFVPEYVPCSSVIMSSISNVPVAVAVQVPDIMDPPDIVMVNDPLLPFILPDTIIVPPSCPPTCIEPANVSPDWVIDQLVPPIIDLEDPLPIIEPLESEALPIHTPVIVLAVGFVGDMLPPHAAADTAAATLNTAKNRIAVLLF